MEIGKYFGELSSTSKTMLGVLAAAAALQVVAIATSSSTKAPSQSAPVPHFPELSQGWHVIGNFCDPAYRGLVTVTENVSSIIPRISSIESYDSVFCGGGLEPFFDAFAASTSVQP